MMFYCKTQILALLTLLLASASPCVGFQSTHGLDTSRTGERLSRSTDKTVLTHIAANNETEEPSAEASSHQHRKVDKAGSKSGKNDPKAESENSSLEEFIPTEKIPADQAVDFPADI
jgi:hypothetical protein